MKVKNKAIIMGMCVVYLLVAGCNKGMVRSGIMSSNATVDKNPTISNEAKEVHQKIPFVLDTHSDTANWNLADDLEFTRILGLRDNSSERVPNSDGQLDLPRLVESNVALQVFALISELSVDMYYDQVRPRRATFTVNVYDPDVGDFVNKTFQYKEYQRNPSNMRFQGPPSLKTYYEDWKSMFPRPPIHLVSAAYNYPCESWFAIDGQPWPSPPVFGSMPDYVNDPVLYGVDGETCNGVQDESNHDAHLERAKLFAENLHRATELTLNEDNKLVIVRSKSDLAQLETQRSRGENVVGAMLSLEGLYFLNVLNQPNVTERVDELFETLYRNGYRMASMTHFQDSEFGGSSTGMGYLSPDPYLRKSADDMDYPLLDLKLGLSKAGTRFVTLMLQRGMVVDVAHSSDNTISNIAAIAMSYEKPIISSHGGVQDCYGRPRNLSHADLINIAKTRGVVGIGLFSQFVGDERPIDVANCMKSTIEFLDANTEQIGNVGMSGIDYVGLGSDFDGGVTTVVDAGHLAAITQALLEVGFNQTEINKIMGGNMKRAITESLL